MSDGDALLDLLAQLDRRKTQNKLAITLVRRVLLDLQRGWTRSAMKRLGELELMLMGDAHD